MSIRYIAAALAAFTLATGTALAQEQAVEQKTAGADSTKVNNLSVSLNFLSHGEIIVGGLPVDNDTQHEDRSAFLMGRARIGLDYSRRGLQAHAVLQNLGIWGSGGNQALNLYEGWVKMSSRKGLFAQIGRIALSYDDERIIGPNDFAAASNSHDVLRLGYEGHGHKLHLILGYNQNGANVYSSTYYEDGGSQYYKTMQTLWYHYDFPRFPLGASLLFMNMGLQAGVKGDESNPPKTVYQQMSGAYLNFHPGIFSLEASGYLQTGKTMFYEKHASKIEAWMASAKASVKPWDALGFTLGYDYLSGDNFVAVPKDGAIGLVYRDVIRGFSPLYGSRTKFYGLLDYFYESAYIFGFTPGLQNAYATVDFAPLKGFSGSVTYHYLAVATKIEGLGSTLGHSADLQLRYKFSKDVSLTAGYTLMLGTETMDRLKQGKGSMFSHWGWFSLVISPELFSTRW